MITLAETKIFLGISGTGEDEKLTQMIASAEAIFTSFCGDISQRTVSEKYCGDGTKSLILNQKNPSFPNYGTDSFVKFGRPIQELKDFALFELEGKMLIFLDDFFPEGVKNIEIKYLCGYSTTPDDVKQALFSLVGMFYGDAGKESLSSESIGDYSVNYGGKGQSFPPIFKSVVSKYQS